MASEKRLSSVTQARKLLRRLEQEKKIFSYTRFFNGQANTLMYRIYYTEIRFFYIKFLFPVTIKLNGEPVSIIDRNSGDLVIFVSSECHPKKIFSLIKKKITSIKNGLVIENKFIEDLEEVLKKQKDLRSVIKSVRKASSTEDMNGIDVVLTLAKGEEMPLQIKSTVAGQRFHRESRFGKHIPSLVYEGFSKKIKDAVLQIVQFYQEYKMIEHL